MAIVSTLNQQRKYLRCHMKPASFFLRVFLVTQFFHCAGFRDKIIVFAV